MILNNVIYARIYPDDYQHFVFLYRGALWNYAAFGLIVIGGYYLFKKSLSTTRIVFGAIGASLLFYLLSNFGVWATGAFYPITFSGLISCYAAGLPFLLNQVLGDMFYSLVLFGLAINVFALKPKRHLA
jgi:hypothetical protein